MKILDFSNSRRSFLMSKRMPAKDYFFFLNGEKMNFFRERESHVEDIKYFCPEILKNKINTMNEIERHSDADILLLNDMTIINKKHSNDIVNFLNKFKGKIVAIGYSWDFVIDCPQNNNQLKREIDALAVAGPSSLCKVQAFPYSQSELDVLHRDVNNVFVNKNDVIKKYKLPSNKKYVLITVAFQREHENYLKDLRLFEKKIVKFIKYIKNYDNIYTIWKIKEKQKDFVKIVKIILKSQKFDNFFVFSNVYDDGYERWHRRFISPINELSSVISCHINLSSISFSHIEIAVAGIPTYSFNGDNVEMPYNPECIKDMFNTFWDKKSISNCYGNKDICIDRSLIMPIIDRNFFTDNLIKNLLTL